MYDGGQATASAQVVYPGYGYAPYGYGYAATAPGIRLRSSRLCGTWQGRNDRYYRDAGRSGLNSTTGGVRLL